MCLRVVRARDPRREVDGSARTVYSSTFSHVWALATPRRPANAAKANFIIVAREEGSDSSLLGEVSLSLLSDVRTVTSRDACAMELPSGEWEFQWSSLIAAKYYS